MIAVLGRPITDKSTTDNQPSTTNRKITNQQSPMAYPPPGRLIDIGTHRLHLHCAGEKPPTVVFDAALGGSSLSWSLVHPAVARITRACTYDRAGFGWSEAGPLPRTAGRIADELDRLLRRAAVPRPYVLVGHSYGGLVMRLMAARHAQDVAGLVLIEPASPEEWAAPTVEQRALIRRGVRLCRYGVGAAHSGVARVVSWLVKLRALAAARALVGLVSRGGLRRDDEGILAPIWKLPPGARRVLGRMWTRPQFFEALGSQIEHVCDSGAEVLREGGHDFGDLPVVVISSDTARESRISADRALAQRSRQGRHVIAPESGHWVPLDAPQTVIDAIGQVVQQIRITRRL
jgi:pimeloyl-ACP methyl ester carboxylesterase